MLQYICLMFACLCLLTTGQPTRSKNNCRNKEKSLISLDVAEDLTAKMKDLIPNCTDSVRNNSDCGVKDKALAYLDIINNLISQAKKTYPTCDSPDTEEPETTQSLTTRSVTTQYISTQSITPQPSSTTTQSSTTKSATTPSTAKPPIDYPRDCSEVVRNGLKVSGVYTIWPNSSLFPNRSLEVFCDMDTEGGGWTVVQRRGNLTPQDDFYRDWNDYKVGFGNNTKEFWLGNDNIFVLSNQAKYKIRFDLESPNGERAYALYDEFWIENEKANYKLHIGKYSGPAGNAMEYHNGQFFSTKDRDNARWKYGSCAERMRGGWWYNDCSNCNLNGLYGVDDCWKSIAWEQWKGCFGLASTEIKIKAISI